MWDWMMSALNEICRESDADILYNMELDDIKSELLLKLLKERKLAEEIYQSKNKKYLRKLVNRMIYELRAGMYFKNKEYFSRFQRIEFVCQKYGIPMLKENAYKIHHMMEYENYNREEFSICHISKLLNEKKENEIFLKFEDGDTIERNLSKI